MLVAWRCCFRLLSQRTGYTGYTVAKLSSTAVGGQVQVLRCRTDAAKLLLDTSVQCSSSNTQQPLVGDSLSRFDRVQVAVNNYIDTATGTTI